MVRNIRASETLQAHMQMADERLIALPVLFYRLFLRGTCKIIKITRRKKTRNIFPFLKLQFLNFMSISFNFNQFIFTNFNQFIFTNFDQ